MNSYIDYTYYTQTFGGTLVPQSEFNKYSIKASNEVRIRIFNRDITKYSNLVKTSTCSVMELIYNQDKLKTQYMAVVNGTKTLITSEKVGDYSRSVSNISASELEKMSSDETTNVLIDEELEKALLFTGLLNRGLNVQ